MDTKRLILAIALSIIVISVYQYFLGPKPAASGPVELDQRAASGEATQPTPGAGAVAPAESEAQRGSDVSSLFAKEKKEKQAEPGEDPLPQVETDIRGSAERDVVVENNLFTAVFTSRGAALKSLVLKDYMDDEKKPLDLVARSADRFGIYPFHFEPFSGDEVFRRLNNEVYRVSDPATVRVSAEGHEVVFEFAETASGIYVRKAFRFQPDTFVIDLDIQVVRDGKTYDVPLVFGPDLENERDPDRAMQAGLKIGAYDGADINSVVFAKEKALPTTDDPKIETAQGVLNGQYYWAAYETTYFAAIFNTSNKDAEVRWNLIRDRSDKENPILYAYMTVVNPGPVYMGPKDEDVLSGVTDRFYQANKVIEYGWFGSIAKIMLKGINLVHGFVPNYGWAIVIFTFFLKLVLFPLTYSSSVSMAKMQTLQPKIKAIKKKYRNPKDPEQRQKMNVEMMALYKQEKVNPAGGCLPMLLQLPILWGLFRLLAVSISVRHEPWVLWIRDLSLKDPYYVLPILMGVTQIILQKMTPSTGEGAQKKMMYIMPVVITIFVANLPSGLTLYWAVSNVLQLGQQRFINQSIYARKKEEEHQQKALKRKKGTKKK